MPSSTLCGATLLCSKEKSTNTTFLSACQQLKKKTIKNTQKFDYPHFSFRQHKPVTYSAELPFVGERWTRW